MPSRYRIRQCSRPRSFSPRFKLVRQGLVEATDRAGDFERLPATFGPLLPRMSRAGPRHEHLGQSLCDVRFIAAVALKGLSVELPFPIPGHVDVLDPTRGGHQIAGVGAIAIAFACGTTCSPGGSDERV
jgi:hypothetical protein